MVSLEWLLARPTPLRWFSFNARPARSRTGEIGQQPVAAAPGRKHDDNSRCRWQRVTPGDGDYLPPAQRLLRVVAERMRWKRALDEARRRAQLCDGELSATRSAA